MTYIAPIDRRKKAVLDALKHAAPTAQEVSDATDIPLQYVRQLLRDFVAAGDVAVRGKPKRYRRLRKRPAPATSLDDFRIAGKIEHGRGAVWLGIRGAAF